MKNMKLFAFSIWIACYMLLVASCTPIVPLHPSDLAGVTEGMSYSEVVGKVKAKYEDTSFGNKTNYIKVLGKKHKIIKHYFTNIYYSDGHGNSTTVSDPYFLIFGEGDKLIDMGYPYEFIRSSDRVKLAIGKALVEEITVYEDE